MGVVYKARDRETGAVVAVKVIRAEIASRRELIERFKTELLLARKITHKNVCRVYDLYRFDNVAVISMEYVEGQSLRALLDRPEGISVRYGLKIMQQVIAGLAEAHAQGVIHRDLKPENILLARDGTVKVMDFGIACSIDTDATLTGAITGTPAYMSPEQASGKTADARSDIYSLGLVMYEMFCGQRALAGETPRSPREIDPHLPAFIERITLKCIAKDPGARFQTISELEAALSMKHAVPAATSHESVEGPLPVLLTRWHGSDWLLVLLAVAGLLLYLPFFQRTSIAPRTRISFDRSVLRRIAQEYAQKLGAPTGENSEIHVSAFPERYEYVAERAGASAALELANNPVPYWLWNVKWENETSIDVDNKGSLRQFYRDFPANTSVERLATEEARLIAETALRTLLSVDTSRLRLETAGEIMWDGQRTMSFTWTDPADYQGLQSHYIVRLIGKDIASIESNYDTPPEYSPRDSWWQLLPLAAIQLILLVIGFYEWPRVNARERWRMVTVAFAGLWGADASILLQRQLFNVTSTSIPIVLSALMGLAFAVLAFFIPVPVELAVRRATPSKLSTMVRLFDRRAASEPCGLSTLRGAVLGCVLLSADTFLTWLGTNYLAMRLDVLRFMGIQVLLTTIWPGVRSVFEGLFSAISVTLLVALMTSLLARFVHRRSHVVLLTAAACALVLPSIVSGIGGLQPYYSSVLLLFLDYLILAWTFSRFDVLTLLVTVFAFSFYRQNHLLLVMFRPTGSIEQWIALGAWALLVLAAAAVTFRSSIDAMRSRISEVFQ